MIANEINTLMAWAATACCSHAQYGNQQEIPAYIDDAGNHYSHQGRPGITDSAEYGPQHIIRNNEQGTSAANPDIGDGL